MASRVDELTELALALGLVDTSDISFLLAISETQCQTSKVALEIHRLTQCLASQSRAQPNSSEMDKVDSRVTDEIAQLQINDVQYKQAIDSLSDKLEQYTADIATLHTTRRVMDEGISYQHLMELDRQLQQVLVTGSEPAKQKLKVYSDLPADMDSVRAMLRDRALVAENLEFELQQSSYS